MKIKKLFPIPIKVPKQKINFDVSHIAKGITESCFLFVCWGIWEFSAEEK